MHVPAAAVVFALTLVGLAAGRLGHLPAPRGAIALLGGLASAALLGTPWQVVDLGVLALLAGLMVLAALCADVGLFAPTSRLAKMPPKVALAVAMCVLAAASALLLNDAAVVALLPVLLVACMRAGADATASAALLGASANVGSLVTPFGNPQNAVLASLSGEGLGDFLLRQGPVAALAMAALLLAAGRVPVHAATAPAAQPVPSRLGAAVVGAAVAGFFAAAVAGAPLGIAAAAAAAFAFVALRMVRGVRYDGVAMRGLDLNVLALFVGIYLLTGGLDAWFPDALLRPSEGGILPVSIGVVAGSNVIGNVPTTLVLAGLDPLWTASHAQFLVTVTTLGGTLLLTGSAATILAAEQARRLGTRLSFGDYLRWSWPILPALVVGAWWNWPS